MRPGAGYAGERAGGQVTQVRAGRAGYAGAGYAGAGQVMLVRPGAGQVWAYYIGAGRCGLFHVKHRAYYIVRVQGCRRST